MKRQRQWYLWTIDRWDGPLRGMIWYQGGIRYFDMETENDDRDGTWYRRYTIHKLSLLELALEIFKHAVFVLWVKKIKIGWMGFYKLFPPQPGVNHYAKRPTIGRIDK